ncbi:hypothetical protein [Pseudochrobactrum asaccharolyticum]|uniref:hypothetical protein n=1 Tax=Pseudochrobactrum asaccharolyticum TaxID=354351 RepID=UPI0040430166
MSKEFNEVHLNHFNAQEGAYSVVTERESKIDSQITITGKEKTIALEHFGEENIHKGPAKNNKKLANKEFNLFPSGEVISLNIVFPKPKKKEVRIYLNKEKFKPKTNDIWFIFKRENKIWIGSYNQNQWDAISQENSSQITNDVSISDETNNSDLSKEIKRMVDTAFNTAKNADGSLTTSKKKIKDAESFTKKSLFEYIEQLIETQKGKCALTGLTLFYDGNHTDDARRVSLDRIDSNGHYEKGNLQVVCKFANNWKGANDNAEFLRLIRLIQNQNG